MNDEHHENTGDQEAVTSLGVVAAHLLWVFVGPFALAALLLGIVRSNAGWWNGLDLAVLVVVAVMIFARWIDQRSGKAMSVQGEPSTWEDFNRYVLGLPVVAAVAWLAANLIGKHLSAF